MIDSLYDFLFMHSDHGSTVYPLVFETLTTEVFFLHQGCLGHLWQYGPYHESHGMGDRLLAGKPPQYFTKPP